MVSARNRVRARQLNGHGPISRRSAAELVTGMSLDGHMTYRQGASRWLENGPCPHQPPLIRSPPGFGRLVAPVLGTDNGGSPVNRGRQVPGPLPDTHARCCWPILEAQIPPLPMVLTNKWESLTEGVEEVRCGYQRRSFSHPLRHKHSLTVPGRRKARRHLGRKTGRV